MKVKYLIKQKWVYIKTLKPWIVILLIGSLITYFSIELWLIHIPECFNNAYEIGQFFSKISIAFITSFIFYFIVYHVKAVNNKFVFYEIYGIFILIILNNLEAFINIVQSNVKEERKNIEDLNSDEISQFFSNINNESIIEIEPKFDLMGFNDRTFKDCYYVFKTNIKHSKEEILNNRLESDSNLYAELDKLTWIFWSIGPCIDGDREKFNNKSIIIRDYLKLIKVYVNLKNEIKMYK